MSTSLSESKKRIARSGILPEFGDYELISEIARGGMGVVYRARQRSLDREVAVKMILAGQLASPESLERFRLEALAAARLDHPGIVRIYEVGEVETQNFFSMELIDGSSLAECLSEFRLDHWADASTRRTQERCLAELIADVARILDFAHQHGVLHRDMKPSNILIDQYGKPHLTDFGLAKITAHNECGITLSNAVLGTPGYLSPEQAAGRVNVTTATDIYGLGAILYELLTGHPPFDGATAMETMWKAIEKLPVPPRQLNPNVHRDLETITLKCLEKKPELRYSNAAEVADELDRVLRREPIKARPISSLEHVWRWCQRNPLVSSMTGIVVLSVLVGTAVAFWQWQRAERAIVQMAESIDRLQWNAVDDTLQSGQSARALAKVASLLRKNLTDWKAASFGMSILEQRRFPLVVSPPIFQTGELTAARLSPDGTRIVTTSIDGTARLWDAETSQQLIPEMRHNAQVNWADFSPDSKYLATCSDDQTARIWEVATGRLLGSPFQCSDSVTKVRFSSNGHQLLIQTGKAVSVADPIDGKLIFSPQTVGGEVVIARFLPGGESIFIAVRDGINSYAQIWNFRSGRLNQDLRPGAFLKADVSDDLAQFVSIESSSILVWDLSTGKQRFTIPTGNSPLQFLAISPDSQKIAVGGDQYARVWSVNTATPVTPELRHYYALKGVAFIEQGEKLLTWGQDSLARIWDVKTGEPDAESMWHSLRVQFAEAGTVNDTPVFLTTLSHAKFRTDESNGGAQLWRIHDRRKPIELDSKTERGVYDDGCCISPNGEWIAINGPGFPTVVVDRNQNVVCKLTNIQGLVWGVAFSADSQRLMTSTASGQIATWSMPDGKPLFKPVHRKTNHEPMEVAPDRKHFVTGSADGFVRYWNAESGEPIFEVQHGSEINSVAVSPDGRMIASAGEDHVSRIWNAITGKLFRELKGHQNEVTRIVFSPDGRRVLTSSHDHTARIWDTSTGRQLFQLPHQGEVLDVAYNPNGKTVATGSRDRTAMIWDANTGRTRVRSLLHDHAVRNIVFSPEGKRLLTVDFAGIRIWNVADGDPLTARMQQPLAAGIGCQATSIIAQFSPDGASVINATGSRTPLLWSVPVPPAKVPAWFPEFLESIAGQRFIDGSDMPESFPGSNFLNLRRKILDSTEPDYYTTWAQRWLKE